MNKQEEITLKLKAFIKDNSTEETYNKLCEKEPKNFNFTYWHKEYNSLQEYANKEGLNIGSVGNYVSDLIKTYTTTEKKEVKQETTNKNKFKR